MAMLTGIRWRTDWKILALCAYALGTSGLLSFRRDPKSFDVWFPTGMTDSPFFFSS